MDVAFVYSETREATTKRSLDFGEVLMTRVPSKELRITLFC